jgi:aminopeptidase N
MRLVMDDNELRTSMKPFVRNFVSSQLERLGWDETDKDSHFDRLLRPIILGMAAVADEPSVTSEVRRLFDEHSADQQIEPDLRGVVYSTISRLGDEKDFNKLLKLHNDSNSTEERLNLCAALTGFEQPKLIDRALQTITSDDVRLQDVSYWISYAFLNYHARPQAWQWVLDNWKWLEKNLGTDLSFYRLPNYIARCYSDLEFLEVYKKFFNDRLGPAFDRPLKQGIETIEWQAAWRGRDLTTIKHFFK